MNQTIKWELFELKKGFFARISEADSKLRNFSFTPIFLWRLLEVVGFCIAVWALLETVKANRLALEAMNETRAQTILAQKSNEDASLALEETQKQTKLAQEEARKSRIINAWQVLANKASGNSGKIEALKTLNETGQPLRGLDLSCQAMDGGWSIDKQVCQRKTYMHAVELAGADLSHANLSGTHMEEANFSKANLKSATFVGSDLSLANLSNTYSYKADFSKAELIWTNLSGADLSEAIFEATIFSDVNISGAIFCSENCTQILTTKQSGGMWAWQDQLPVIDSENLSFSLCDPILRLDHEALNTMGKPGGC